MVVIFFLKQVTLIGEKSKVNTWFSILIDLLNPLVQFIEGVLIIIWSLVSIDSLLKHFDIMIAKS